MGGKRITLTLNSSRNLYKYCMHVYVYVYRNTHAYTPHTHTHTHTHIYKIRKAMHFLFYDIVLLFKLKYCNYFFPFKY